MRATSRFAVLALRVLGGLAAATFVAGAAQAAPQVSCRDAEEQFGDVQVKLAEAYGAGSFEKAEASVAAAKTTLAKGVEKATSCGCPKALPPADATKKMMDEALKADQFSDAQERLYQLIGMGEGARHEAEACWREAAGTPLPAAKAAKKS